jgi:hypothetical protein
MFFRVIIALAVTIIAAIVSRQLFQYDPPGYLILLFYLSTYVVVNRVRSRGQDTTIAQEPMADRSEWPLSGPLNGLGKTFGRILFSAIFWSTHLFSILNPFQLKQVIYQLAGNAELEKREEARDKDGSDYVTKANYRLPFHGEWLVYNGGMTPETSHSWEILSQRYALDFVKADEEFKRHKGNGNQLNEYYCYGEEILAAASGFVIQTDNSISDAPFPGWGFCDFTAKSFIGNFVLIQHAEAEYGFYAHLVKESICVSPGEFVEQGQVIGKCGHSGHSSEPHLHFHLQDSSDLFKGIGLPVKFHNIEIDQSFVEKGYVSVGKRVRYFEG